MKKQTTATFDADTTKAGITIADLRLRMAEHIIAQDGCYGSADVRDILTETKVGAWRSADLLKKLKVVFSAT